MSKTKFWLVSGVIWLYWLLVTVKVVGQPRNEPLLVSVFVFCASTLPWAIDTVEMVLYQMIRGP